MQGNFIGVALDGISINSISPSIVVVDVSEAAAKLALTVGVNARYDGQLVTNRAREEKSVKVRFAIREQSFERRAKVLDDLMVWLRGRRLSVGYRPNQVLECTCTEYPEMGSAWKWTDELECTFTAYESPFWLASAATNAYTTETQSEQELYIAPPGTVESCRATIKAVPQGAEMTELTISCAETETEIELTGLSVPAGTALEIGYDEHGIMHITAGDTDWYGARTAGSSDDILLYCRRGNTVTITADCAIYAQVQARGAYL